ncbi:hypothetical protein B484DRAFT_358654 [Ochromonadaceae sp. CCMP2298]|nr:hypothetical protein B484DRAFT_358654 [Ochromonadaceae sp. CCMP2298]
MAPAMQLLILAAIVQVCSAFTLMPHAARTFALSMSSTGSPLPELVTETKDPSKINNSPLVDRALDSALDFLQDAEVEGEEEDDEFDIFEIYEDSPDLDTPYDLIAELEAKEAAVLAGKMPSSAELNEVAIKEVVARWRMHEGDVGSAQVQVAIANERVGQLTKHLLANKKDMSAKRGLQAMVVARRKHLNYLYKNNITKALEMVAAMGIRFRPQGNAWDKTAKYGAFKNTKPKYVKSADGKFRQAKK